MKTLATGLVALAVSLAAADASESVTPPAVAAAPSEMLELELGPTVGLQLDELLLLAWHILGVPVVYDAHEVQGVTLTMAGPIRIERGAFRGFFDDLLRSEGFVSWDAEPGAPQRVTVARMTHAADAAPVAGQLLDARRLDEAPARITGTYSVVFPLRHLDGRSVMATLSPYVGSFGSIRNVAGANQLLVTSPWLGTLRELRDVLAIMDAPSRQALDETAALDTLRARVDALEQVHAESSR